MTTTFPLQDMNDCWNRIGVAGDQSCEKLTQCIHCRNCDVYASAAQGNLQRPVDAGYRRQWAEHFRQPLASGDKLDSSVLVFRIGREWLALPTTLFVSVAPQAKPHKLPHRNERGLAGIVNVGGTLYPCMALADLLGVDESDGEAATGPTPSRACCCCNGKARPTRCRWRTCTASCVMPPPPCARRRPPSTRD